MLETLLAHMSHREFDVGEVICPDLAASDEVFFVQFGAVVLECVDRNVHKDRRLGILKPHNSFIGLEYLFLGDREQGRVELIGLQDGGIYHLSRTATQALLEGELYEMRDEVFKRIVSDLSRDYLNMRHLLEDTSFNSCLEQIKGTLQMLKDMVGQPVNVGSKIEVPLITLANLAGVPYESARRAMHSLTEEGKVGKVPGAFILYH